MSMGQDLTWCITSIADAHGNLLALQAVSADMRAVAYDWDGAARQALAHGFPNAARWVATERA